MDYEKSMLMNSPELELQTDTVELIAPDGLGFGEGGISVKEQLERGIITEEAPVRINEILTTDRSVFKDIEVDDDGCGDGRPWSKIIQLVGADGDRGIRLFKTSLLRAKVFGGGLVAASSMWRMVSGAPGAGSTVGKDREFVAGELKRYGISHGAHSDDHAEGENSGCGAIDNYPKITANAVKYRREIIGVLQTLYGDSYGDNKSAIDTAFEVYEAINDSHGYFSDASGKRSMDQILESGAVVKELSGRHVEETIIINEVPGTTLDQQYFTEVVKNACTEGAKPQTIQAFSVDVWRGQELARVVADIADGDKDEAYKLAYADFLIRTLAVAATLTAGDLPVYRRTSR